MLALLTYLFNIIQTSTSKQCINCAGFLFKINIYCGFYASQKTADKPNVDVWTGEIEIYPGVRFSTNLKRIL